MILKTQRPDGQRRQMVRRVQKGLCGASCNCASRYSLAVEAIRGKCACQDGMNIFFEYGSNDTTVESTRLPQTDGLRLCIRPLLA